MQISQQLFVDLMVDLFRFKCLLHLVLTSGSGNPNTSGRKQGSKWTTQITFGGQQKCLLTHYIYSLNAFKWNTCIQIEAHNECKSIFGRTHWLCVYTYNNAQTFFFFYIFLFFALYEHTIYIKRQVVTDVVMKSETLPSKSDDTFDMHYYQV